jgi:DHA1 family multidrug resistance protein B-like MFS transporter
MIISSGIWTFAGQLVWPFQTIYILNLGGSYFQVGLVTAIGAIAGLIPTLYGGYLADTIGRKKIVAYMSVFLSLNSLLYAIAKDWRWLILASVINSVASGLRQPSFSSIIDDSTDDENRAQIYALWMIIPPLFGLVSPYLMGVYMEKNGVIDMIRLGYFILFAASFTASILRFRFLEESLPESDNSDLNYRIITGSMVKSLKRTIHGLSRTLWVLGIMGLFFGLGAAIGGPFWITYATEDVIGLTLSEWGIITTLNTLVGTIIGIPFARIADNRSRLILLYPSVLLTPFAIVAFIHSNTFSQTLLVSLGITILGSMGMSSGQALFTDNTSAENRGKINSLWSVAGTMQAFRVGVTPGSILGAIGSIIGGYFYQNIGKSVPLYLQSILITLTALTAIIFLDRSELKTH